MMDFRQPLIQRQILFAAASFVGMAMCSPSYAAFQMNSSSQIAPAPVPVTTAPGAPQSLLPSDDTETRPVRGEGKDMPLQDVVKAIVPPAYTVKFDPPGLGARPVSFSGNGRQWGDVWRETLTGSDLEARSEGKQLTVFAPIVSATAVAAPVEIPPSVSNSPLTADTGISGDSRPSMSVAATPPVSGPVATSTTVPPPAVSPLAVAVATKQIGIDQAPIQPDAMQTPLGAAPAATDFNSVLQVRDWSVLAGSTFAETVSSWTNLLGLPLPDDKTGHTFHIDYPGTYRGTYLQALEWACQGLADDAVKPDWKFSRVNLVTVLVLKDSH